MRIHLRGRFKSIRDALRESRTPASEATQRSATWVVSLTGGAAMSLATQFLIGVDVGVLVEFIIVPLVREWVERSARPPGELQ
jgi:hypothetical protein